jgi:hypothetical protein
MQKLTQHTDHKKVSMTTGHYMIIRDVTATQSMYRAAKFVAHARKLVVAFGRHFVGHLKVFVALPERLLRAPSP